MDRRVQSHCRSNWQQKKRCCSQEGADGKIQRRVSDRPPRANQHRKRFGADYLIAPKHVCGCKRCQPPSQQSGANSAIAPLSCLSCCRPYRQAMRCTLMDSELDFKTPCCINCVGNYCFACVQMPLTGSRIATVLGRISRARLHFDPPTRAMAATAEKPVLTFVTGNKKKLEVRLRHALHAHRFPHLGLLSGGSTDFE